MKGFRLVPGGDRLDAPRSQSGPGRADGSPLLEAHGLERVYSAGGEQIAALRGVQMALWPGRVAVLRGRSGAGKTTLLNLIAGLDEPTAGSVRLFGMDLATLSEQQRTALRRGSLGFVFQAAHLFPNLTALENVELPLRLARAATQERKRRAAEALEMVGLAGRARHRALELSGGEQQRVAIARALAHGPRLVLADEPTGNLDSHTGASILQLIRRVAAEQGVAFLIATHDPQAVEVAHDLYDISDGMLMPAER
ncbi:MAG TPA: ABC transporter ATP-binding protein [Ktedonobacterales bacterium]|nr:ABC transporter ATP-binding protein [Ktedonobacterales bacterium]